MIYAIAIGIGLVAGVSSGLFGVGGGVIIVPLSIAFFKLSQQSGNATSLIALVLPVGALGIWQYHQAGFIGIENLKFGGLIAAGILVGTFFGARLAVQLSSENLAKMFSIYLLAVAIRTWLTAK